MDHLADKLQLEQVAKEISDRREDSLRIKALQEAIHFKSENKVSPTTSEVLQTAHRFYRFLKFGEIK